MAVIFARRPIRVLSEAPVGVQFKRATLRADGSPGDIQHWNHADGGWENAYDVAKHVRRLDKADPANTAADLCYPVPLDVANDPDAYASTHTLNQDGVPITNIEILSSTVLQIATNQGYSVG